MAEKFDDKDAKKYLFLKQMKFCKKSNREKNKKNKRRGRGERRGEQSDDRKFSQQR